MDCVPGTVLRALNNITHGTLLATLRGRLYFHLCCINEKWGTERFNDLAKDTQPMGGGARTGNQAGQPQILLTPAVLCCHLVGPMAADTQSGQ